MKKIISILAVGVALIANADYIYWMVDTPATGTDASGQDTTFDWAKAVLSVDGTQIGTLSKSDAAAYQDIGAYAYSSIGNYSDSSTFLIELYSSATDSSSWMASTSATASALRDYIFGNNSMSAMAPSAFGLGGTGTYSVPEPTSGLLFVLGGMLLGLRRRRQQS